MDGLSSVTNIDNTTFVYVTTTYIPKYSSEYIHLQEAANFIGRYYIWILFAFGFPGNLLSLFVVVRMSRHRMMTPLFYVGLLAVVDNIAIILKITENQIRLNGVFMNAPACKILYFLGFVLAAYSNWILIVMSAERFTAVRFPFKVGLIWSVKRAVIIISIVLLFLCLVHFHFFFSVISKDGSCLPHTDFLSFFTPWWFFISSFIYAIIPAIALTIINILMITVLRKSANQRQSLGYGAGQGASLLRRQDRQVTIMLVYLAVVFIILTIPRCVFVSLWIYWKPETNLDYLRKTFVDIFTGALADFNHAVNFYLYFVSAKKFRKYLIEMISSICSCVKRRSFEVTNGNTQSSELPLSDSAIYRSPSSSSIIH